MNIHAHMYVCMYVYMYVCMYVCIYIMSLHVYHLKYAYETSSVRHIFKTFQNQATAQVGPDVRVRVFESRTAG
jgi:hypothetical protein